MHHDARRGSSIRLAPGAGRKFKFSGAGRRAISCAENSATQTSARGFCGRYTAVARLGAKPRDSVKVGRHGARRSESDAVPLQRPLYRKCCGGKIDALSKDSSTRKKGSECERRGRCRENPFSELVTGRRY